MTLSLLGSANLVRPGLHPNGPSDMALAIATWEKMGDRNDSVMHPPQVAATRPSTSTW